MVSSVLSTVTDLQKKMILLNSSSDDVILLKLEESKPIESVKIAENSQVSCMEKSGNGIRTAVIERNAVQGSFSDVVLYVNDDLSVQNDETWRVNVRGFVPDPGTRCGFVGKREMLVTGMRPRGDHLPYHGLFLAKSRALEFFETTQDHTPSIMMTRKVRGAQEVLLRDVRRNEENKPVWPYVVMTIGDDNTLHELVSADFIVPDGDSWAKIDKNGCLERENVGKICLDGAADITDVQLLPNACGSDICMIWSSWKKTWIVRSSSQGKITGTLLPEQMRIIPMDFGNDMIWGMYEVDDERPDIAQELRFVRPDMDCLGI